MADFLEGFNKSLQTGFVDKSILSAIDYQPELLVNHKSPPRKVLSSILYELENCTQFYISVAFVTTSGVAAIINTLKVLEHRGIKGEILVSQYLNFTQPEALKKLMRFKNISLKISITGNTHTKGYIFKTKDYYNLIVGSSNLTAQALSTNKEWNIKVSSLNDGALIEKALLEFHSDFEKATVVTEEFISAYEEIYEGQYLFTQKPEHKKTVKFRSDISPNSMQSEALVNLQNLRNGGKNKALIISATGTGKTYLSAFDAKAFNPKKLLFVVHRLTIAKDSLKTFRNIFGDDKTMGLYSGNQRDLDCDFIFSTIQTISKPNHLDNFSKTYFDYIIIDETHRSGADSYLRLMEHFEPKFLLGMTATPERTDGNNIFQLFDHNIAYEIRLSRAMEEEMLSSFHYYGVTDLSIDNIEVDSKSDFKYLVANERVDRIIEQANFYGSDNGITRGLVFCSRKNEAIELSGLFNLRGFKTVALTGESSEENRTGSIEKLESDDLSEKLDYIFTVDIFNEGIDIPRVNQIIMLRPTDSAIIFIQQLGRGLRKVDGKGYLTVIDFIGNYENNYLIPIALYGDTSYNKDSLRKLITEGSRMIPGSSTINFDEITKEKIFKAIDSANLQLFADLKKDYNLLKFKLGRLPMMVDFIDHGSRDPFLFVDYSNSYYNFVLKVEERRETTFTSQQLKLQELFCREINNGVRIEESLVIKLLLNSKKLSVKDLKEVILERYGYTLSDKTIKSCVSNLNFKFIREKSGGKMLSVRQIYNLEILIFDNEKFTFSDAFTQILKHDEFRQFLVDSTEYSIREFDRTFKLENWRDGFVLYKKYSRKDVFRILNFAENPIAQNVGGYLVSPDNTQCPIFVNYHKEDNISDSIRYEDEFVNPREFDWMSKSNRNLLSKDVQSILGQNGPIRLLLFIKKNNDEGLTFYYMGDVLSDVQRAQQTTIPIESASNLPVVKMRLKLTDPVSSNMYRYLHENFKFSSSDSTSSGQIVPLIPSFGGDADFKNPLPLFDFYAAAGTFSEIQTSMNYSLIDGPGGYSGEDYFACKVVGESMNRIIPNGSICLFKRYTGGSRNGKILLIENRDIQDVDFNSAFTVKTYLSIKSHAEESWEHQSILLKPNSFDRSYEDIILDQEKSDGMRVIGEFVRILD